MWRHRLAVRTEPSQGLSRGSIPLGATKPTLPLQELLGIIVFGEEHFLVRGPEPDAPMAAYLVRRWIFPSTEDLLGTSPPIPAGWRITSSEFRENIVWAVHLSCTNAPNSAVAKLLEEIETRGVRITKAAGPNLP